MPRAPKPAAARTSTRWLSWHCRFEDCDKNFRVRTRKGLKVTCPHCHRTQDGPATLFAKPAPKASPEPARKGAPRGKPTTPRKELERNKRARTKATSPHQAPGRQSSTVSVSHVSRAPKSQSHPMETGGQAEETPSPSPPSSPRPKVVKPPKAEPEGPKKNWFDRVMGF